MSEFKVGDRVRLIFCRRYGTIVKEKEMFGTKLNYRVLFDYEETDCLIPEEDLEIVDEHGKTLLEQRIEKLEKCVMGEQNSLEKCENVSNFELTEEKIAPLKRWKEEGYKWIFEDTDGTIHIFKSRPIPYNIEELLKGECGNE